MSAIVVQHIPTCEKARADIKTSKIALSLVQFFIKSALNPVQFHKIYVSLQHIHQFKNK